MDDCALIVRTVFVMSADSFRLETPPERLRSGVQPVARAANDHEPPELADDECEGLALALLTRVGAEGWTTSLAPRALARALGLRLLPTAPSGCRGTVDLEARTLRYDGRGSPETVTQRLAHELGHLALAEGGARVPHPEESASRVAMALVVPRAAARAAVGRAGLDPVRILAELPGPPPAWVLVRVAWVARRAVIVRLGGERWTYAPDGAGIASAGPWEREMVAIVRRTGRPHRTILGDEAWPVGFAGHEGVVIVLAG